MPQTNMLVSATSLTAPLLSAAYQTRTETATLPALAVIVICCNAKTNWRQLSFLDWTNATSTTKRTRMSSSLGRTCVPCPGLEASTIATITRSPTLVTLHSQSTAYAPRTISAASARMAARRRRKPLRTYACTIAAPLSNAAWTLGRSSASGRRCNATWRMPTASPCAILLAWCLRGRMTAMRQRVWRKE